MWIRFVSDAEKRGTCEADTERFSAGQVAELPEDQGRRWLRRNLAVVCDPPDDSPGGQPGEGPAPPPPPDPPAAPRRGRRGRG